MIVIIHMYLLKTILRLVPSEAVLLFPSGLFLKVPFVLQIVYNQPVV